MPQNALPLEMGYLGHRADIGTTLGGVECIQYHQPGIIDPAVGIFKAASKAGK
jgi:hypothetical protein